MFLVAETEQEAHPNEKYHHNPMGAQGKSCRRARTALNASIGHDSSSWPQNGLTMPGGEVRLDTGQESEAEGAIGNHGQSSSGHPKRAGMAAH